MDDTKGCDVAVARPPGQFANSLSTVQAVWGIGLLILCGAALATCWRMMDLHDRQQTAQIAMAKRFHADLIDEMRTLTGHAAATVTSDLCRVRFRLRLRDSHKPPVGAFHVRLLQDAGNAQLTLDEQALVAGSPPVADFGLLAPGKYRLAIEDKLGMECDHSFEVAPGVPFDRVAFGPVYESWMFFEEDCTFQMQFERPAIWGSRPIVAVVHLRSGASGEDNWVWRPPRQQRFDVSTVISTSAAPVSEERIWGLLPQSLADRTTPLPSVETQRTQQSVVVPYACCEVYGLSFFLADPEGRSGDRHLGTYLYEDQLSGSPGDIEASDRVVLISSPCPRQTGTSTAATDLAIPVPQVVAASVLYSAEQGTPGGA